MLKWILLALLLAGCSLTSPDNTPTITRVVYDTILVHDTIYSSAPVLGAPQITSLTTRQSTGQDGKFHNYIDVEWTRVSNAIGYKVYYSATKDSAYSVNTTGAFSGASKNGVFTYSSGTLFFKVAPIGNDGTEGPQSSPRAIVYDGVAP